MYSKHVKMAIVVLFAGLLVFMGCDQGSSPDDPIPVSTVSYELTDDGEYYQFKTNDEQYYLTYTTKILPTLAAATDTIAVSLKKDSGTGGSGNGMVCFYQNNDNFYNVVCDATGWYRVNKKIAGLWSSIAVIPWTQSAALLKGYGAINTLSVEPTGADNMYDLRINNTLVYTFANTDFTTGGKYGMYCTVAAEEDEDFPDTPVDIKIKMTSPIVSP